MRRLLVRRRTSLRLLVPLFALLALFTVVLVYGLYRTVDEANKVDEERSRQAVAATLHGLSQRIAGTAYDNAYWDDLAAAVYSVTLDKAFLDRTLGVPTADKFNFDRLYIVDRHARSVMSYVDGKQVPEHPTDRFGQDVAIMIDRGIAIGSSGSGFVKSGDKIAVVGISPIAWVSDQSKNPRNVFYLVIAQTLTPELLLQMEANLALSNLRLAHGEPGRADLLIRSVAGASLGRISWDRSMPGWVALTRSLPLIGAMAALALLLTVMVARQLNNGITKIAHQAKFDSLSSLPNRAALRAEISARVGHELLVLGLLDLDGFKTINDLHGHQVGDQLVVEIARLLEELHDSNGIVARLGGDEFAFLAAGPQARETAEAFAAALLERLASPFRVGERTLTIGASIGLALSTETVAATELLRRADIAMYVAKRSGKMRSRWFDEAIDAAQLHRHQIETELRAALEQRQLTVVYQPQMDIDGQSVVGVEALVRWTSQSFGEVSPDDFIPVAEETGLIDAIGLFVLREACTTGLAWPTLQVAVNVSAAQLRNPALPGQIERILACTGFPPERLELEITETYLVRDPVTATAALAALRAIGVSISLDDFGTGYASIGFLRQFSFDRLKLDRSLIAEAEQSHVARALVQASVAVAQALEMRVTAEGVETHAQAALMRVAGCDQLQGWLFAKACTADEVGSRLKPPLQLEGRFY